MSWLRVCVGQAGSLRRVVNPPAGACAEPPNTAGPGALRRRTGVWLLLFAALAALSAFAQTAAEKPGVDVLRVGRRLQCQCGCKDSVATCSMLDCSFSKPAKERIARMQSVGMTDDQIVQAFIRDYGPVVYLAPPSAFGWAVPYGVAGLGLVLIWLFVRKYYKPRPLAAGGAPEPNDPAFEKYKDQIEKDLADLE